MNVIVYKNAVQRDDIQDILKDISKCPVNTGVFLKVSPYDIFSEYFNWFYTHIDDSYSFTGVRGIFYMKSSVKFSIEDLSKSFFSENSLEYIRVYPPCKKTKGWFRVFLNDLPAFTLNEVKKSKFYEYTVFFPGSPAKPIQKDHPLKSLTMYWPVFEDCQFFEKDDILISLLKSFSDVNFCDIEYHNNFINEFMVLNKDMSCFERALKTYNSGYKVFTPEIYSILVKKSQNINISYSLDSSKHYFSSRIIPKDFVRQIYLPKGTVLRFLYTPMASRIYTLEKCHEFARNLWNWLDCQLSGTSYYQIAFDEIFTDLNTTLSYGHNTPKERYSVGKSQIYFYIDGKPVRIGIYTRDMILITVPPDVSFSYKGNTVNSIDLINIITDFCLSYT